MLLETAAREFEHGAAREFEHGAAECLSLSPLFIGCRGKIEFVADTETGPASHPRGQALVEIEFLTRMLHRPPRTERDGAHWTCVLPTCPPHLPLLSRLFPRVRFYAYAAPDETGGEYDPADPSARARPYTPAGCEANTTALCQAFDSETARLLGGRARSRGDRLYLLFSERLSPTRQMLYHALAKPAYSLLSVTGAIPEEYLSGDLYYPLYTPVSSSLVHIAAPGNACARLYFPLWLRDELAHFQVLLE